MEKQTKLIKKIEFFDILIYGSFAIRNTCNNIYKMIHNECSKRKCHVLDIKIMRKVQMNMCPRIKSIKSYRLSNFLMISSFSIEVKLQQNFFHVVT